MQKISIGELDTKIEIITVTESKSAISGEAVEVDSSLGFVFSKPIDVLGNETIEGRELAVTPRNYIVIYAEQLLLDGTKMYVKDIDGKFDIHSVSRIGRKQWLQLKCTKRA